MSETEPREPRKVMVDLDGRSKSKGLRRSIGGSPSDVWNDQFLHQTLETLWVHKSDPAKLNEQINASVAALQGIGPRDELEAMLAGQLLAAHSASMECYRRAMLPQQTLEGRRENLSQANKLSRSFATLMESLNRHRGKGHQRVTVEHVHVHSGGQAVVGVVEPQGGGEHYKVEEQAHAKQIAHEPEPTLRSPNETRDKLPISGDGERAVPDARRKVTRGSRR
jgi:hypothetical protein